MENDENELYCAECGELIEEDAISYETDDGYLCESCFDEKYFICELCGETIPLEDMKFWGDSRICPDCLEEECPGSAQEEDDSRILEAYQAAQEEYIGRKTTLSPGNHCLTHKTGFNVEYSVSVDIDDESQITALSELSAEILAWETERSSGWEAYPIEADDYDWILPDLLDEYLLEEDA